MHKLYYYFNLGYYLLEFVSDYVVLYLEDDHVEIREAAALTCCKLLKVNVDLSLDGASPSSIVNEVVEKLLVLGITDPGNLQITQCGLIFICEV